MKIAIVLACLVAYASAHMCMLSPEQRGGFQAGTLTTAGANQCLLIKDPPCGGAKQEEPINTYHAGKKYSFVIQKNLDHFYSSKPGSFALYFWPEKGDKRTLFTVADSSSIKTLDSVAVNVTIPDVDTQKAIIQGVYTTNNPSAPAEFYQCADIMVMKK